MRNFQIIILFALVLFSCKQSSHQEETNSNTTIIQSTEKIKVKVIFLKKGLFYKEILANGKLKAHRKAELKFRVNETVRSIFVRNGQEALKGDTVGILYNFTYQSKLINARNQLEKAKLELQDELIGKGYKDPDSAGVPASVWKIACIRSGYANAFSDLKSAEYDYQGTFLTAPFAGVIANLKSKEHNLLPASEPFCILIDNTFFDAEFNILESELGNVRENELVSVVPFSGDSIEFPGVITEINPLIDDNGLVKVKAKVKNSNNALAEGMNIKVIVKKAFPGKLVVPKEAVVLRTGKEVVFTYENGLAKWNYVITGDENSTSFIIKEGLAEGMKVIVSGNINLGHDAPVEIINEQ